MPSIGGICGSAPQMDEFRSMAGADVQLFQHWPGHAGQTFGVAAPPGRVAVQKQVFAHQVTAQRCQKHRKGRRVDKTAADGD